MYVHSTPDTYGKRRVGDIPRVSSRTSNEYRVCLLSVTVGIPN